MSVKYLHLGNTIKYITLYHICRDLTWLKRSIIFVTKVFVAVTQRHSRDFCDRDRHKKLYKYLPIKQHFSVPV
uniref:Uncharacterized protein n=1 Tax=Pararge aegeria TaxID=116150 RepID=S4P6L3_9NEOP